jgi:hypothetical protein
MMSKDSLAAEDVFNEYLCSKAFLFLKCWGKLCVLSCWDKVHACLVCPVKTSFFARFFNTLHNPPVNGGKHTALPVYG